MAETKSKQFHGVPVHRSIVAAMEHGYGRSLEEVATGLIWRSIEELRTRKVLRDS